MLLFTLFSLTGKLAHLNGLSESNGGLVAPIKKFCWGVGQLGRPWWPVAGLPHQQSIVLINLLESKIIVAALNTAWVEKKM
jgi:hypothetical protein